jgi:DNA glycosylase AlkZ-like
MRPLTLPARNRAVLARQLLLDRAPLTIPRALERMGGIQAQYAPSGYVGLWTRLSGFRRDDLTRALERRSVVQATLMRATIHLVSRRDFWPFARAIEEPLLDWWFRATSRETDRRKLRAIDRRSRVLLAAGPMRRAEIVAALKLGPREWDGVGLWTPLVRVPPSGTWERRRADLFAVAEDWIGPPTADASTGRKLLVRRYLAAFGPAAIGDIATFTGIPRPMLAPVLASLPIRRFVDEEGGELLDVRAAPLPDPATPAPVRFLPTWDATLLAHARRTGILPEAFRPRVFTSKTPHSLGTFLVDGAVAGTWRPERGRIVTKAFGRLSRHVKRELDDEAERLAEFHA